MVFCTLVTGNCNFHFRYNQHLHWIEGIS
ncbi:hypothetical protein Goklo_025066 [Gossypium klotzschianum]|uniref:Uncharacterized protein n=1 Tax=Gossypium klotzschianum TaxID=34286 RepID=A0A7J8W3U8_9ROSI|nr:hypothetical protein [Gossypium klotzschianum]